MGERGERRRVGVVVGGHVHRLQRRDRVTLGRGDALLQLAHLVGERRLVAHRRRHAAEQRRHLGARLHEPEDVVDEQQHVLVLHVAEVLGDGERRQRDAQAHARRLVHLAVHERGLLDDARLLHLEPEVGALTGALADAGEHRHATVLGGDAVDHLLDEHGLADARAAEEADLAALHVGLEQVDDLDAGLEHLRLRLELVERRRRPVDLPAVVDAGELALRDVERLADHVEHVAEHAVADRHRDAAARGSCTSVPRRRPSVGFRQMARTRLSPICCATSAVMRIVSPSSSASICEREVDLGQARRAGTRRRPPGRRSRRRGLP